MKLYEAYSCDPSAVFWGELLSLILCGRGAKQKLLYTEEICTHRDAPVPLNPAEQQREKAIAKKALNSP